MYRANAKITAYRKVLVHTGDRKKILLMLYDGAVKYANRARAAMVDRDWAEKGKYISDLNAILIELQATLNHRIAPELCENLDALYQFMIGRLIQANIENDPELLDSIIGLLTTLRDGWKSVAENTRAKKTVSRDIQL